jgi:glycosyltransferase involved in cell wall biosynthesis
MRRLHVHYVLVRFPKLSETFVLRELLALEDAGWTVTVDALEGALDEPRDPALAELRAHVRRVPDRPGWRRLARAHVPLALARPAAWGRTALRALREGRIRHFLRAGLVAERARRAGAELLHVHFAYYAAEYARDASELTDIPYSVTCHANDIWSEFNAPHLTGRIAGAVGVATWTEYNERELRRVAPGVPVRRVSPIVTAEPLEHASREGPVLAVARAMPKKGLDTLLEACAAAEDAGERFEVEVVGDGPELAGLRELAAARGVHDRVRFRGACTPDAVADAYSRCFAVAVPSRIAPDGDRDGLPTVLFEAMGRGIPVVATHVVGIPELVRDGENGLLIPPDDPAAMAEAIARLHREPGLAERLGREARVTFEEYDAERTARRVRDWLTECAGRAPASRTASRAGARAHAGAGAAPGAGGPA